MFIPQFPFLDLSALGFGSIADVFALLSPTRYWLAGGRCVSPSDDFFRYYYSPSCFDFLLLSDRCRFGYDLVRLLTWVTLAHEHRRMRDYRVLQTLYTEYIGLRSDWCPIGHRGVYWRNHLALQTDIFYMRHSVYYYTSTYFASVKLRFNAPGLSGVISSCFFPNESYP